MTSDNGNGAAVRKHSFEFRGEKYVIPEGRTYDQAIEDMERQRREEQVVVAVNEPIRAFPLDGAAALMRVLQRRYGQQNLTPTDMGFWGKKPPAMISVEVAPGERIQVPWGNCQIPKVEGTLSTGFQFNEEGIPVFSLRGEVKRASERLVAEIAEAVREEVRGHSLYHGKAIKLITRDADGNRRDFDPGYCPTFLDPAKADEPVYPKKVAEAVRVSLFNPVLFTKRCRDRAVSLKRGVLLYGAYGVGKSMCALTLARACVENGWTFLYLQDVRDYDLAVGFAKLYAPCVIFSEDMDLLFRNAKSPDEVEAEMSRIREVMDGIEAKGQRASGLISVFTTNHREMIHPAFRRPGRIDLEIEVTAPDEEACVRIVRKYAAQGDCVVVNHDGRPASDAEVGVAIRNLVGANAAFFQAVLDLARLGAVESDTGEGPLAVRCADLEVACHTLLPQVLAINPDHGKKPLSEVQEAHEVNPLQMAVELLTQAMAEKFTAQLINPKKLIATLKKVRRRPGGDTNN